MRRRKRIGFGLAILGVGCFLSVSALAQEEPYEKTMSPGIHIRADSVEGSALATAVRAGGSVVISDAAMEEESSASVPLSKEVHVVQPGDTLWDICEGYFSDPYVWPLIWSYNAKITNPNWIFPGDRIRLTPGSDEGLATAAEAGGETGGGMGAPGQPTAKQMGSAVLLKNRGFIDEKSLAEAGVLVGAHKPVNLLAQFDEAYVEFNEDTPVRPGDEYAAFEIIGPVDGIDDPDTEIGKLVEIFAVVRVTQFNPENRIARVKIDETTAPLERGVRIGKIHRKFDLTPAVTNDRNIKGNLIAFLDPVILAAEHQIVFVDRGLKDGVRDGNRFFAVERRDGLRHSWGEPNDREGYPIEVIAELRVIEARPKTSTCLITQSTRELEVGQKVEMRKGY